MKASATLKKVLNFLFIKDNFLLEKKGKGKLGKVNLQLTFFMFFLKVSFLKKEGNFHLKKKKEMFNC